MSKGRTDLIRKTVRLQPIIIKRIKALLNKGKFVTESEVIRRALEIGLSKIEKN